MSESAGVRISSEQRRSAKQVWLPYAIAIGAQLPLVCLYLLGLVSRVHYQFFPFAIALTCFLAWQRWPRGEANPFHSSAFSSVLVVFAVLFGLAGVAFVTPWFSACSVVLLVASLFSRTIDTESRRTLFPCVLPLATCIHPPGTGDMVIIGWLQSQSAAFTSRLLDLIGYVHHMPGTVIQSPLGKEFGIAEACSGVTSFFMLLFAAIALNVWLRRPWFQATVLVLTVPFWAVLVNTGRIIAIPVADNLFEFDLSTGWTHTLLGYLAMVIGIGMLLSTDQFLQFLFGATEDFSDENSGLARRVARFWNRVISGQEEAAKHRQKKREGVSRLGRGLLWTSAVLLGLAGVYSLSDVYRSWNAPGLVVRFFDSEVTTVLDENDLPAQVALWNRMGFRSEDHGHGSDLGKHSDVWQYASNRSGAVASFDQAFPGWHELTTCYRNQGWQLVGQSRLVKTPDLEEFQVDGEPWLYVQADFEKPTGERGFLLFSLFDAMGNPQDPPTDWGFLKSLVTRLSNRLSHRIRTNLFQGEAYQTQVFMTGYGSIPDDIKEETVANYLVLRDQMRKKFLARRNGTAGSPQAEGTSAN